MRETPEVEKAINTVLLWSGGHVELSLSSHWEEANETSHYSELLLSFLWTEYRVIGSLLIKEEERPTEP